MPATTYSSCLVSHILHFCLNKLLIPPYMTFAFPLTQLTWVWASSGRWWRTGKPAVLQSLGSQRVGHDWMTEQQQPDLPAHHHYFWFLIYSKFQMPSLYGSDHISSWFISFQWYENFMRSRSETSWRVFMSLSSVQFSSIQPLSHVWLFVTPWTAAHQAFLSITNSQSLLKLMSIESVMPSNHLILCLFSSCLQSFPASGSFPMSHFFASDGQSFGVSASASVLPMNIQDWFPLGWTGWISLQSKGLSRVFSNTTVQKHQFFGTQLPL